MRQLSLNNYQCLIDTSRDGLREWINDTNGYVHAARLATLFYHGVEVAMSKIIESGESFDNLRLFKQSLILCDKVSRLQLMWNGQQFKNMMISVDLAVTFRIAKDKSQVFPRVFKGIEHNVGSFAISKISRHRQHKQSDYFVLSSSNLENHILDH